MKGSMRKKNQDIKKGRALPHSFRVQDLVSSRWVVGRGVRGANGGVVCTLCRVRAMLCRPRGVAASVVSRALLGSTWLWHLHGWRSADVLPHSIVCTPTTLCRTSTRGLLEVPSTLTQTRLLHWPFPTIHTRKLEADADRLYHDAEYQTAWMKSLNRRRRFAEVVRRFESHKYAVNMEGAREYIRAATKINQLDRVRLDRILERVTAEKDVSSHTPTTNDGPGSTFNPLHVVWDNKDSLRRRAVGEFLLFFVFISLAMILVKMKGYTGIPGLRLAPQEIRPDTQPPKMFKDVQGCDEAKDELLEVVEYLKNPTKFTRLGGKLPKGILLVGQPGTGKTLLARAIAGEADVPFFYAAGSEFEELYVGVGAKRVRELFGAAKKRAPCIIFLDEIDAAGGRRHPRDQQHSRLTLNQLLAEMDGFKPNDGVVVIGATNTPEILDKALIRPGRFDRHVVIPLPDVEGRRRILLVHIKGVTMGPDVDLMMIARGTPGLSGAELSNLVNTAAIKAAMGGKEAVSMAEMEYAKDKIIMGTERKSAVISEETKRLTAYHEGGHALVALYSKSADPVHKVTIMPRGMALGMVSQLPEKDDVSRTRAQLLASMDTMMGGRAAEELIFGSEGVTSGALSDIEQATNVARLMVRRFGMSDKLGPVDYNTSTPSDVTSHLIDEEVKQTLQGAQERAKKILMQHRHELDTIAEALLKYETLSGEDVQNVVAGEEIRCRETLESGSLL